jgi:formylglycine-generating enzyme required for sulfatase activity
MKKAILFQIFMFCILIIDVQYVYANNIKVADVVLTSQNFSAKTARVRFNLSWENSWRVSNEPNNWDAAWVFVKYRKQGETSWKHASISNVQAHHTAPSGSVIMPDADGVGAFVYRSTNGTGNFIVNQAELQWKYGSDVLSSNERVEVRVYAIEMVYVPTGTFYLGSEGLETSSFTDGGWSMGPTIPYKVLSEGTLAIDDSADHLWGIDASIGNVPADAESKLTAAFPKGYQAFYCMKYEVSQGQYRDFLNALTRTQQAQRISHAVLGAYAGGWIYDGVQVIQDVNPRFQPANRIGLRVVEDPGANNPFVFACDLTPSTPPYTSVNQSNDGEWISMGMLSWMDLAAYLDWAGLRPMTELEFEKTARGDAYPLAYDYAWGDNAIANADDITDGGTRNEICPTNNANAVFDNVPTVQGPLRQGVFAANNTDRTKSGASYYGVMELSGNVTERAVTVGNQAGRNFTGLHGTGTIGIDGNATQIFWPGSLNGIVLGADGIGFRGGDWFTGGFNLNISDRTDAATVSTLRSFNYGGRGVRTAP